MRATRWKIREQRSRLHSVCTIGGIEFGRFCGGSHESVDAGCSGRGSHAGIGGCRLLDREARRPGRHTNPNRHRNTADAGSPRARRSGDACRSDHAGGSANRPAAPAAPTSTAPVPLPQPAAAPDEPFAYRRFALDTSRAEGEACLAFNKPLATSNVNYADYVTITPEVKSALRVVDDRLCIGGLAYGENYKVRLRTGFPGRDGVKLDEDKDVEVALGARPAVVTLPGKGFILPRGSAVGLPITTINVSQVGIAVYRVNERAIMGFARDRYDATYPGSQPITEPWGLYSWLSGTQRRPAMARHHGGAQRHQPAGDHRLPDPRDRAGLEARHLLHRRLERRPAAGAQLRGGRRAERQRPGDRHVGDGHRHRAHHLHRRRRAERLRPLAADRQAARQPRSHPAVARQRADGQGDDRRGRPRPVRRRPAQGPRRCPRRRRHGVRMRPAGFQRASSSARRRSTSPTAA